MYVCVYLVCGRLFQTGHGEEEPQRVGSGCRRPQGLFEPFAVGDHYSCASAFVTRPLLLGGGRF